MIDLSSTLFDRWEEFAFACGFSVELFADDDHPNRPAGLSPFKDSAKKPMPGALLRFKGLETENILYIIFISIYDGEKLKGYNCHIYSPIQLEYFSYRKISKEKGFSRKDFSLRWNRGIELKRYFDICFMRFTGMPLFSKKAAYYIFPQPITIWDAYIAFTKMRIEYQWTPQQFKPDSTLCMHGIIKSHGNIGVTAGPTLSSKGELTWSFLMVDWRNCRGIINCIKSKHTARAIHELCEAAYTGCSGPADCRSPDFHNNRGGG